MVEIDKFKKDFEWARKETLKKIKETLKKDLIELRELFWFKKRYRIHLKQKVVYNQTRGAIKSCAFCYIIVKKGIKFCYSCPIKRLCQRFEIDVGSGTAFEYQSLEYYYEKLEELNLEWR